MKIYFFVFFSVLLVSCGGGGGGGSSSTPTLPDGNTTGGTTQSSGTSSGSSSTTSSTTSTTSTTTNSYNPNLPSSGAITLTGNFETDKTEYEETQEYQQQYGLDLIKASSAYARGATGRGAIIGIMDSGVDNSHQELNGFNKIVSGSYLTYQDRSPTTDEKRHGSHVSGIALGERDGSGIHGVAFDAQLFFISIELGTAGDTYEPATIDSTVDFTGIDNSWSQLEAEFVTNNVTVVNGSFGYQGNINDYTEANIREAFPKTIGVLAQPQKPNQDKTIFVWAAGNGGGYADQGVDYSSPEVFGGLAYLLPELRGNTAAVVSIDEDGSISSFSNRCGVAKDYCLAAPGRSVLSIYAEDSPNYDSYGRASGTSMAAPHVSGGIALLADYFEGQLGNTEILQRLFATANKSGIYAESDIYGQGLMDLNAATQPLGTAMIATSGASLSNLTIQEEGSYIGIIGPAFGNSIANRLGGLSYVVFDDLGAPFKRSIDKRILNNIPNINWLTSFQLNPNKRVYQRTFSPTPGSNLKVGLVDKFSYIDTPSLWASTDSNVAYFSFSQAISQRSKLFFGNGTSPNTYLSSIKNNHYKGIPFLDFSSEGSFVGLDISLPLSKSLLFSFFEGSHQDNQRFINSLGDSKGVFLEFKDSKQSSMLSYQMGVMKDSSSLLGISSEGGFGSPNNSSTSFLGFESLNMLRQVSIRSSIHLGKGSSSFNGLGFIDEMDDSIFTAFNFSIFKDSIFSQNDSLSLEIYQPLRSEVANLNLNLPVGRTKDRKILFNDYKVDLTPSGRQINSQLVYSSNGRYISFFGKIGLVSNEFHNQDNDINPYFLLDIALNLK
ncbi:S8 family serine peptidase [Gammaproteobacteria bacterium]|nr:S8 family serine peptidase [Gammaproteobacteria bacterium]MDB3976209.1 S8 family serine peptidase [Gammaproteobacteria bacterium]MDC0577787.1 S8 family serine peptidase [Gammaproteobacteria bacterium]